MKKPGFLRRGTALKPRSTSDSAEAKVRIQALLRQIAIHRDGGCVMRHYPEAGDCGPYKEDGELILQAEHLVTRANSISYADLRNVVCLCQRHHMYFKQQHGRLYWELIERHVGPERWLWLKAVEADKKPYRFTLYDWLKAEMYLRSKLEAAHVMLSTPSTPSTY